jgi:hypothetical protein
MLISSQKVVMPDPRQARNAVRTLWGALPGLGLPDDVGSAAARALEEIEDELRLRRPDRGVITARLERFTELLAQTGAIERGGSSLVRPIRAIAAWVGPVGAPLFARLT